MKKLKIDSSLIFFTILVIIFILWSILVLRGNLRSLDDQVFSLIHHIHYGYLTSFFKVITYLGSAVVLGGIVLFVLIFAHNKFIGISMGINLFLVSMLNLLLKNIFLIFIFDTFLIPRPDTLTLISEDGFSYPSGHAMVSLAFYGFAIYLINMKMKASIMKKLIMGLLVLFIILVGFSRIYLGVHHFSDIIGGYIISLAYLILYIKLDRKLGVKS